MPAQYGRRLDDEKSLAPAGPKLGEAEPKQAVRIGETKPTPTKPTFEHGDLMAQGHDLGLERGAGAEGIGQTQNE